MIKMYFFREFFCNIFALFLSTFIHFCVNLDQYLLFSILMNIFEFFIFSPVFPPPLIIFYFYFILLSGKRGRGLLFWILILFCDSHNTEESSYVLYTQKDKKIFLNTLLLLVNHMVYHKVYYCPKKILVISWKTFRMKMIHMMKSWYC